MLRHTIGDSLFFATLHTYCADTNLKFKSAITADFNAEVNTVTGQNYNWFFNEWIYYPNHPQYENTYFFEELGNGSWNVNFMTTQIQTNAPFFKMPLDLKIHFQDNSDTLISVMNDINYQEYDWIFNKQPVSFTFDPDNDIVLKLNTTGRGKVWTGSISNNWNDPGNWSPAGVPGDDNVRIAAASLHMPIVKDAGMTCGSLTIEKGASLTIDYFENLTIKGRLTIEGVSGP